MSLTTDRSGPAARALRLMARLAPAPRITGDHFRELLVGRAGIHPEHLVHVI